MSLIKAQALYEAFKNDPYWDIRAEYYHDVMQAIKEGEAEDLKDYTHKEAAQ